jgi:hypothetical protein
MDIDGEDIPTIIQEFSWLKPTAIDQLIKCRSEYQTKNITCSQL